MPGIPFYDPGDKSVIEAGIAELTARRAMIAQNWRWYNGDHPKHLKTKGNHDDNLTINFCRDAVDHTIAFLFPSLPNPFYKETEDNRSADLDYLSVWTKALWAQNNGASMMIAIASNGAVSGDVYLKVLPRPEEDVVYPRIINLNPANIVTYWQDDDFDNVLAHVTFYGGEEGTSNRHDVVHQEDGTWIMQDWTSEKNDEGEVSWRSNGEEVVWEYAHPPVVHWQHLPRGNSYYGNHEFGHAYINDAANKVASDIKRILRFHAFPRTIGIGFSTNSIQQTSVEGMWTIEEPGAQIFNLEMQSDLSSSMTLLDKLEAIYFRQSRVVVPPGNLEAFKGTTQLGIRASFMSMISKNEVLRRNYSNGMSEVTATAQIVQSMEPIEPEWEWQNPLPFDEKDRLELIERQRNMGIMSRRTAATRLGLNYDKEREYMMEEFEEDGVLLNGGGFAAVNTPVAANAE
ncbi:MAG: hypothetical protein OHK0046_47270 [Anaerolineae bacterium]